MTRKINILLLGTVLLALSCQKNVVTGKHTFSLIPESQMIAMSSTEYEKFLLEHPPLSDADSRTMLVKRCAGNIQKAVEQFFADKKASNELRDYKWTFNVVDDNTVNAWCMPGGKIVVYTGLLPVTQDEASLAVVLGHEIAHAIAHHGNQRMSEQMAVNGVGMVLFGGPQSQSIWAQVYGVSTTLASLKYSRNHETEADRMGLIFAAMAGYDPEVAITFWERMSASGGAKPPQFLSTHPSDEKRIQDLKAYMPTAKKYYKPQ
jgi:predicted Zn-dependent protease